MVYLVGLTRGSAMVRGHLGSYERILNKINKNNRLPRKTIDHKIFDL